VRSLDEKVYTRSGASNEGAASEQEGQTLSLRVLGAFELRRGDGPPQRLPRKAQALLAYLALQRGRPIGRDQLATLLWGDSSTEQARQSLRQALASLRSALGPEADSLLAADNTAVQLTQSREIMLDATRFEAACRSARLDDLETADALYRDDLLAGLNILVEPFNRWATMERQRFLAMRLDLLQHLAVAQAEAGRMDDAIESCRRLTVLDPLREEAHRLSMRLLASTGRRSAALRQYEDCARLLREELGVDPDDETSALAQAIRTGAPPQAGAGAQRAGAPVVSAAADADGSAGMPGPGSERPAAGAPALPLPDKPSIVVMPFANLSGDASQDHFVEGLVDDLTVALGREPWLFVVAGPPAAVLKEAAADPREVAARVGVRYALRGSVRVDSGRVLIVAQLSDAALGAYVWSGRFEDEIDHLFAMQDRLTTKVAAMIGPALRSAEVERALRKPTDSLTAFDLYLRALPKFKSSRADNREALRLLDQAVALDPGYGAAYALAARCYQFQLMFDWLSRGDPGIEEGIRLCRRAAATGGDDSEALWMTALAQVHLAGEIDHCLALIERSLSLNPNSANAWLASCLIRGYLGDCDTAVEHFQRAQRLNPLDLSQHVHWNILGIAYWVAGRYQEAADAADRALSIAPTYPVALRQKVSTCGVLGRVEEARAALQRLLALQPGFSIAGQRAFLSVPLQHNLPALERYLEGFRRAGAAEGSP
jgi:DNA-binding SARP family transcriptional activator/TolB-like protein